MRADVYLVEKGFATTRSRAVELIERKFVSVNGVILVKKNKDIKKRRYCDPFR